MKLRELSIPFWSLLLGCALLISSCSEERKREAAKLENQLRTDSSAITPESKPGDTATSQVAAVTAPDSNKPMAVADSALLARDTGVKTPTEPTTAVIATGYDSAHPAVNKTAAEPVADVNAVPDEKNPPTAGGAAMPPYPHDGYTIQILSTPSRPDAEHMAQDYTNRGYQGYVSDITIDGKTHYRVRIGFYGTEAAAKDALSQLKEKEGVDGWIDPVTK
jgi:septal ring-binding cell division protein DamX